MEGKPFLVLLAIRNGFFVLMKQLLQLIEGRDVSEATSKLWTVGTQATRYRRQIDNAPVVSTLDNDEGAGWAALRDALSDPDRTVRRKAIFLLNALLIPQGEKEHVTEESQASSTAVTAAEPSEADSRLHTDPPAAPHPNSHAAALANPDRGATSPLTRTALAKHGIVESVVEGLVNPVPSGVDGDEAEEDLDFVEGCVR